jgi:RNA polymerase sigma factor (sigma-70 family)
MNDYIVQVAVKNGPMLRAMRLAGFETAAELSRASGVGNTQIGKYLNLQVPPITKRGDWSASVLKIAKTLRALPEDLFPPQHVRAALPNNRAEFEASLDDLERLATRTDLDEKIMLEQVTQTLLDSLETLPPRSRRAVDIRYGLTSGHPKTLSEVGKDLGVCTERAKQIIEAALRKLRLSRATKELSVAAKDSGWRVIRPTSGAA